MKTTAKLTSIAAAIVALFGMLSATAQPGNAPNRIYDPKTVETVQGTVLSKTSPPQGRGYGVHLKLQTVDKGVLDVHLGPAWYLDKQTPRIEAKDVISVTGSLVTLDGKPAIIASEVKQGTGVLTLRDKNGIPKWAGKGGR